MHLGLPWRDQVHRPLTLPRTPADAAFGSRYRGCLLGGAVGDALGAQAHCLDGWLLAQADLHSQRAPGTTCMSGPRSMTAPADLARNDSKGCGGVMRVAPIGLFLASLDGPGAGQPTESFAEAFEPGCVAGAITHGHPAGQLASGFLRRW